MDDILTTKQAAAYIKKPIPWIREHVQELGGSRLGRDYRFEREELLKYVRRNRVGQEWSIPEIVDTSEKRDNAPGGV